MTGFRTRRLAQWQVILPVGLAMALSLAGDLTLYAVLPVYAVSLEISLGSLGLLLSANRLVRLVSNPSVGLLIDRWGRRPLVLIGLLTGTLSTLTYVLAKGFWLFFLGRLLWGVSWSLIYIGAYCMVLDVTDETDHGWGSGVLQTFYFIGLAASPLLGGLLSERLGFSMALSICAGLTGLGFLVALLFLPETYHRVGKASLPTAPPARPRLALSALKNGWFSWNSSLVTVNYLYVLVLLVGEGIIMSTITLYLQRQFGNSLRFNGLVISVAAAGGGLLAIRSVIAGVAAPFGGWLSDRLGSRWEVVGWGVALSILGCALLGLGDQPWLVVLGLVLVSFGGGALAAVLPAMAGEAVPAGQKGLVLGILNTCGDIGSALGPLMVYTFLGALTLSGAYLLSAALLATGLVAVLTTSGRTANKMLKDKKQSL